MSAYSGELRKLTSLPSVWAAFAVGIAVPAVVGVLSAVSTSAAIANGTKPEAGPDLGYQELAFGVAGAIILGVVAASSEYFTEGESAGSGRQITTSLTAVPSRTRFLLAKVAALTTAVVLMSAIATGITLSCVQAVVGDHAHALDGAAATRVPGVVLYWVLTALLAFGITLLTRNGVVPLAVLVLNTSVVTVTFLLSKVTPLAVYFPDLAGMRMFLTEVRVPVELSPITGGVVMAVWVVLLLACGFTAFTRRDA